MRISTKYVKSLFFVLITICFFSACQQNIPERKWRLVSKVLKEWTQTKPGNNKGDSLVSVNKNSSWETSFQWNMISDSGEVIFYAPDTLNFDLLLNNRFIIHTDGQSAIWPAVTGSNEIPILSHSAKARGFAIDMKIWKEAVKDGNNKLLLKMIDAPRSNEFMAVCGLYIHDNHDDEAKPLQLYSSVYKPSGLPVVNIDLNDVTLLDKEKRTDATMLISCDRSTAECDDVEMNVEMKIRGFSSSNYPKKQYSFKVESDSTKKEKHSLLGMNPSSKWILQGLYSDPSFIRNAFVYELWRKMGYWAPQSRFVEVVINGSYQGVYLLMERVEISPSRLKLKTRNGNGDAFLVQINRPEKGDSIVRVNELDLIPDDPPGIDMDNDYLHNVEMKFAILLEQSQGNITHNTQIDRTSFADYLIVQELTRNPDAYHVSTWFHKDDSSVDDRIKAGPVWDFDLAIRGSMIMKGEETNGFVATISSNVTAPFKSLFRNPEFRSLISERYQYWRNSVLTDSNLLNMMDSISSIIPIDVVERNFIRFPVFGTGKFLTHPVPVVDRTSELNDMKSWLQNRMKWLDRQFPLENDLGRK